MKLTNLAPLLLLAACTTSDPTPENPAAGLDDAKADGSGPSIADIGPISLAQPTRTIVTFVDATDTATNLAYVEFTLSASATVNFQTAHSTDPHAGTADVDAALFLYKPQDGHWGTPLAFDIDNAWPMTKDLDAGTYRLLMYAPNASGIPILDLVSSCTGTGC